MNARTILIISVLALGLAPGVGAQQTHHGESFTLNSVLNPTQDHDYAAGWYIDLVPGFLSQPQEGNATDLRIDPYYNAPNEHGLLYNIPPDHDISGRLGFYPMDFRVNECGAATVSMPLEFPEGINGMTPHLSLEYNSQAGNGIMGLGWSLGGMSKISRVPYTYEYNDESHSVHFSGEDQLSLDGVILRKGTVNGAVCYYPEFYDYSVVYPVTEGFKVLKRNGLVYTYTSRYYLQQSITEPIEWHLSKVEDPDGNSIEYKYWNDRDEGAFLPTLIRYTCREGASPTYEIKFTYDTNDHRPDCPRKWFSQPEDNNFRTGFSRVTRNLEKIDCWHGTEKLVTYSFDYGTLDWNTKALAYVKKSFHNTPGRRDAVNAVVPVKFLWNPARHHLRYEQAGGPIDLETAYDSDHPWRQHTAFSARFGWDNMDHKQKYEHDIVHLMHDPVNNHYHLNVFRSNNNVGQQNQVYSYSPGAYRYDCGTVNQALADGRVIHAFMPADTDGDGLDEIVCVHTLAGNLKVSLIRPDSCVFHETVLLVNSQSNYDVSSFQTGDFNGDGLSDLLCFYSDKLLVRMSVQDTAFSKNAVSTFPMTGDRRVVSADFSGDLKDQIVVLRKTGNSTDSYFFRVTEAQDGTFSILPPKSISVDMVEWYYSNSCNRLCRGDFNGDGKQDILLLCSGAWRFYFSQGNGMFTEAQTMGDNTVVHDAFATSSEGNTVAQSFAVVADFDRDGCDDVSLTLLQDFVRPTGTLNLDINYKGAFRRDFLIRPTPEGIQVRRIRKTRGWWENGILQETDVCIDSIVTNAVAFSTWNVFLPVMGNHKGTSPCEILYCRMGNDPSHTNTCAFLHNTGNFHPDSLTRAITGIVNSLGATIEIHYTPVSYQHQRNENVYGKGDSGRSLTPVLPFNGSMDVVERVLSETKDKGAAQDTARTFRLTRYHFYGPRLHTRGKGFLGFETVWTRKQGQYQKHDIVTVMNQTLDQTRHILVPDTLTERHYRQSNTQFMDAHLQTIYTYAFQDNTAFAGALGQIPDGVFAPYLASSMTVRNDGSPVKYEKTATSRDGYGNTTLSERSYGNSTSSFPYYEKTETTYDHSTSSSRWILGVPASETVTLNLTGVPADKVVRHTSWQNDMTHARHVNMVKESGSGKQLTETYGYDTFGHTSSVTSDIGDGSPRTETFSYTSDGRFMSSQTNASGHTTQYHYDNATGLLDSITDPNGLTTRYRYDFLWDLVQTVYPSGVLEDRCMMWVDTCHLHVATWHPDTPGFGAPVYYTWCKRSGERESVSFYDQHRRKLREVGCTLDGRKVYVDYRYNDVTGLLTAVSAPYCPENGETAQFTQYTYDHLDRSIRTERADGAYASHSYSELTETFRSFDGQIRTLTHSRAGLVTKVSDYGDSNTSPVDIDYTYYGDGRVKSVKVGGDNATQAYYTYDVHRNPATVIDPALGRIEYDYNGFGELVRCITPRDDSHYGYDALGRMVSRTGYDGTSSWIYDVGFLGALWQTVYTPTAGHRVTEQFAYDRLGRMTGQTQTVGTQEEWAFEYGYDAIGRRNAITYPSGKKFQWHYDRNGFMDRVSDAADNTAVWQAEATDRWGNTTEFTEGNVGVNCVYDPVTGLPTGISARKGGQTLFGQACHWSTAGNLEWRTDTTLNLKETFTYDRFNRLLSAGTKNLAGTVTHATQGIQFDGKGNITQKDGVGGYVYGRDNPYAITALGPDNAVAGLLTAQTVTYTPFDKVAMIEQDGATLSVGYGIDRQRVTQTHSDITSRSSKRYFTPLYETVTENNVTKKLHYLTSASGIFAIFVSTSTGGETMYYTLKDHQGSLAAVIQGNTVERLSYDPWGRRRNTSTFGYSNVSHTFDRGYTLHEHYDGFDLINMNGRLYDPILGRMLSPDVVIQDEQSSQAYNRYSYCFNNPLRFTDPSGYVVRGSSSLFNGFTLFLYESPHNKGVLFNTDEALGQQLPKIEPFGEEEKKAYIAYRNTVFSYNTKEFKTIQTELIRLENAEEVFRIRMGENTTSKAGGGNFIYNKETGEFDVNIADYGDFSTMGKIAHELKHADQYMDGKIGFDLRGNTVTPFAYDYRDEVEAFERQGLFGNTLTRDEIKGVYYDLWNKGDFKTNKTIYDCDLDNPARPFFLMKKANSDSYNYKKTPVYLYHGWKKDIQ